MIRGISAAIDALEDAKAWLSSAQRGDPNGAMAYQAAKHVQDAIDLLVKCKEGRER